MKVSLDVKELTSMKIFPLFSEDSFWVIIASFAHSNLELHQMDVQRAFLNGQPFYLYISTWVSEVEGENTWYENWRTVSMDLNNPLANSF